MCVLVFCVYPICSWLSLLDIWKNFVVDVVSFCTVFLYFSFTISSSSPYITPHTYMLDLFILFHRSLRLCSLSFFPYFPVWILYCFVSSSSLNLSSIIFILLLIQSSESIFLFFSFYLCLSVFLLLLRMGLLSPRLESSDAVAPYLNEL